MHDATLMQELQAVFYPGTRSSPALCVAVARIVIQHGRVSLVATPAAAVFGRTVDLSEARAKIQVLVDLIGAPDVVERLRRMHSEYWSFEPIQQN